MRLPSSRRPQRPGAALVETAFIAIFLFLFMFAIFEFGRYMMTRQLIENAARSGARTAVTEATSYITQAVATADVTSAVSQNLANLNMQNLNVQVYQADNNGNNIGTWTLAQFGGNIVVQIDADLPLMFPTFGFLPNNGAAPNSVHISTKVMMRNEAN
jgi:Flp pilus assembly protein TadG